MTIKLKFPRGLQIDRNYNILVNKGGKHYVTGWLYKDGILSKGKGWHIQSNHYTERQNPMIHLDIWPCDLTLEIFLQHSGWSVPE